jgi:hypothetical protein
MENTMVTRREWLRTSLAGSAAVLVANRFADATVLPAPIAITVYKTPACGCCKAWVKHLEANGFVVTAHDMPSVDEIKTTQRVPAALESCHTAIVGRYTIEGHVPADVIKHMLQEKPAILGLAVPGMPMGSPGMEGGRNESYEVIAFERDGKTRVYAKR